jgi:pyruvate,water dikinase
LDFILDLGSPEAVPALVGVKGTNLSKLIQSGFRVPPGFVVTVHAYQSFAEANQLPDKISGLGPSLLAGKRLDPESLSRQIQALFRSAVMPDALRQQLLRAYRELGERSTARNEGLQKPISVAVRSSAVAEDLAGASFAGQLESFLNVRGEAALCESVIACFTSLWNARAIAYRRNHARESEFLEHAVIVQEMVPADFAGVLFTVNPTSGMRDEIVINAAWGLGEAVVSGRVNPDHIVLEKSTGNVKRNSIGDKEWMAIPQAQGISLIPVACGQRRQQVLSEAQVADLWRLGLAIEKLFGTPQDVEWAQANGQIYVLQARPATSIFADTARPTSAGEVGPGTAIAPGDDDWPASGESSTQSFDLWTRANVGELWPDPVSPLIWSIVPEIIGGAVRFALRGVDSKALQTARWAGRFYGRVYYNQGALTRLFKNELGLPASFVDKARGNRQKPGTQESDRVQIGRLLVALPVLARLAWRQRQTASVLEAFLPVVKGWTAGFKLEDYADATDRQFFDEAMVWFDRIKTCLNLQNEMSGASLTALATLERLMSRWFKSTDVVLQLLHGISGIQATAICVELARLAQKVHELGFASLVLAAEPKAALNQLRQEETAAPIINLLDFFLMDHGHRCMREAEWLYPRWADEPEQVVALVAAYLKSGCLDVASIEAKQRQKREESVAAVERRLGPFRRWLFRRMLARTERAVRLRDNGKGMAMKASHCARQITITIGERWSQRGWLHHPDDIFFLAMQELRAVVDAGDPARARLDLKPLVHQRRQAFEHWFGVTAPEIIGADGKPIEDQAPSLNGTRLEGIGASGGKIKGRVRIILEPAAASKLQAGEILVTRAMDTGWTAVFPLVSGIITETGGQLSHAAIVAREYGVPAVVNVLNVTQRLKDGQMISLDGSLGHVFVEAEQARGELAEGSLPQSLSHLQNISDEGDQRMGDQRHSDGAQHPPSRDLHDGRQD